MDLDYHLKMRCFGILQCYFLQCIKLLFVIFCDLHKPSHFAADAVVYSKQSNALVSIPLDIPLDATEILLQSNRIATIEDFAFSGFASLYKISLNKNSLTYISQDAFNGTSLEFLELDYNGITAFPDLRAVSSSLLTLSLVGNPLTDVNCDYFQGLILDSLSLGLTQFCTLPSLQCIQHISSTVRILRLNNCGLTTIETMFQGFQLTELDLSLNHGLTHLQYDAFTGSSVIKLFLTACGFEQMPDLSSIGSSLITLHANLLPGLSISTAAIQNLDVLQTLELGGSSLIDFPDLSSLGDTLITLNLSDNHYTSVPDHAFEKFTELQNFFFREIPLTYFPNLTSIGPASRNIYFQNGDLMTISPEMTIGLGTELLDLEGNQLYNIDGLVNMDSLEIAVLTFNKLEYIDGNVFEGKNGVMDLANNPLKCLTKVRNDVLPVIQVVVLT